MRTLLFWTMALVSTSFFSFVSLIGGLVRAPKGLHDWVHRGWSRSMLWAAGARIEVYGLGHVLRDRPQVFMSNHESNLDTFVLLVSLPASIRFVAKKELSRIPVLAQAMKAAGHVFVDRGDREAAMMSMREAGRRMEAHNLSLGLYPEGTRSRTGSLGDFRRGTFVLAIETQEPIIPVAILGSRDILAAGSPRIRSGKVSLRVGPQIQTAGLTAADRETLLREVRAAVERLLDQGEAGDPPASSARDRPFPATMS
ncbi:MAG: lysophospholipid acyltransferase family protein [Gemmatimonadota bacterium]